MNNKIQIAIIILIALIPMCVFGKTKTKGEPMQMVQQVINVPGASTSEVFVRANTAAVDIFVKSDCVIEFTDKDAGIIKGKFLLSQVQVGGLIYDVKASITVEARDGRARITFSNITSTLRGDAFAGLHRKQYAATEIDETSKLGVYVKDKFTQIINAFTKGMQDSLTGNDDW